LTSYLNCPLRRISSFCGLQLADPEAGLRIVEELAAAHTGPLFLMCACEDAATCHRREVGRLLKKRGYSVSEYPFDES